MFDEPQMKDLSAEKQAAKAIQHTLRNISKRPGVAWYLGHGTQTYALLTEAHATLHGITMEEAQENWPPADQPEYSAESLNTCPFCGSARCRVLDEDECHFVQCDDCHARGPRTEEFYYDTKLESMLSAGQKWCARKMPR